LTHHHRAAARRIEQEQRTALAVAHSTAQLMRVKKLPKLNDWLAPPKRRQDAKPPERQKQDGRAFMRWFSASYRGGTVKRAENGHG